MKNRIYLVVFFLLFSAMKISSQGTRTYEWGGGAPVTVPIFNPSSSGNKSSSSGNSNNSSSSSGDNSSSSSYKSKAQIKREQQEEEWQRGQQEGQVRIANEVQERNRKKEEIQKQTEAFLPEKQDLFTNLKRPPSTEMVFINKDVQVALANSSQNISETNLKRPSSTDIVFIPIQNSDITSAILSQNPYISKGTYYGILQDLAQTINRDISYYFLEADWNNCTKNSKNFFTTECKNFQKKYNQFWRDVITKDPSYEVYQKFEKELVDLGIDGLDILTTAGVTMAFTPAGRVVVAGPQAAVFTLLKELNQGKSIDDPEVWKKVAISAGAAGLKAGIKADNPLGTAVGKSVVGMGATILKGEENSIKTLEGGGATFLIETLELDPVSKKIISLSGQKIINKKYQQEESVNFVKKNIK